MNKIRMAIDWAMVLEKLPGVDEKKIKSFYVEQAKTIVNAIDQDVDAEETLALLYLSGIYHGVETMINLRDDDASRGTQEGAMQ